jgi:hypothetical protein
MALAYNLALLSVPKYGLEATQYRQIAMGASYYKELAESYDKEDSIFLQPDPQGRY